MSHTALSKNRVPASRKVMFTAFIALALVAQCMQGQSASAPPTPVASTKLPAFDVVSIKPDKSGSDGFSINFNDGNFDASGVSLETMIINAYNLKKAQLFGLPKWGDSMRFDIKAKVVDPDKKAFAAMTDEQSEAMLVPILTDRFQLKFHREKKVLPVYELVLAKGGAKIKATAAIDGKTVNGMGAGSMSIHNREMTAVGIPIDSLVTQLSGQLGKIVVDRTGLTGTYDMMLTWSPDDGGPQAPDATAPSIFTALQEQLGLKLQSGKAEIDTFVVDSAAVPEED